MSLIAAPARQRAYIMTAPGEPVMARESAYCVARSMKGPWRADVQNVQFFQSYFW